MSITDELREWASANLSYKSRYDTLIAIADRIDQVHEEAVAAARSNGVTEYGSMVAREYVKLPVDADGVPIRIGDRMENGERVARIVITDDQWEPSVYLYKLPNVLHEYFCNEVSHYKPTVEDVLTELEGMRGNGATYEDVVTRCAELAEMLRELLAGEVE